MAKYVTFGEIMARMEPSDFRRIRQALPGSLDVTFAGSEANVAASLAYFGEDAAFVTALPDNALADACVGALRNMGVVRHRRSVWAKAAATIGRRRLPALPGFMCPALPRPSLKRLPKPPSIP